MQTVSAATEVGLDQLWAAVLAHKARQEADGTFGERRRQQGVIWMRDMVRDGLEDYLAKHAEADIRRLEAEVADGRAAPSAAAAHVLACLP